MEDEQAALVGARVEELGGLFGQAGDGGLRPGVLRSCCCCCCARLRRLLAAIAIAVHPGCSTLGRGRRVSRAWIGNSSLCSSLSSPRLPALPPSRSFSLALSLSLSRLHKRPRRTCSFVPEAHCRASLASHGASPLDELTILHPAHFAHLAIPVSGCDAILHTTIRGTSFFHRTASGSCRNAISDQFRIPDHVSVFGFAFLTMVCFVGFVFVRSWLWFCFWG